ncbi:hypothetical protein HHI36_003640 [Cryptolaemus montrouzieri]|uniref:Uncharacterized protein n=1 Tax=Cryptolaemus montrouzieri TaxID=559131 RepID=A0ABD2PFG0_9CUCU
MEVEVNNSWSEEMEIQTQQQNQKQKTKTVPQIPTRNKFGVLANLPEASTPRTPQMDKAPRTEPEKQSKCPPIIITQKIQDLKRFHKTLKQYIKGEYTTQYSSTQIKIHTKNMADYQTIIKELRDEEVEFYTYTTKDQLRKKLVIKTAAFVTENDLNKQLSEVTRSVHENEKPKW